MSKYTETINTYYLLNECEVFTGELLPAVFVQTERSEVCAKTKGNNYPVKTEQMSLISSLLYDLFC